MAKMALKVKARDPYFVYQLYRIQWCMFGENLVIPAQICDELTCGLGKVYGQTGGRPDGRMGRRTDADNDNTHSTWPERSRVKNNMATKRPYCWLRSKSLGYRHE